MYLAFLSRIPKSASKCLDFWFFERFLSEFDFDDEAILTTKTTEMRVISAYKFPSRSLGSPRPRNHSKKPIIPKILIFACMAFEDV